MNIKQPHEAAASNLRVAAALMDAVKAGDAERLRDVYTEDVAVWHTFDRKTQNREQSIHTLLWMHRHVKGLRYEAIRVDALNDGFVQQHVVRADTPQLDVPCMMRVWCRGSRISRIEEYLDSADSQPLTAYIEQIRHQKQKQRDNS